MNEKPYCPIRIEGNICRATEELCDDGIRENCVERIRRCPSDSYKKKFDEWILFRLTGNRGGKLG